VAKKPVAPKPIFLREGVAALAQTWAADGRVGLLAATGKGLYRTFDPELGGQMITYGAGLDIDTTYVATDAGEPNTIWVGTVRSGVLVSRDSGATWRQIAGIPATSPVTIIKQDPRRLNRIYVGNKQTLYASQDGGETWRRRGGGLPFGEYYAIVINPQNSDEIVAGNAYQNELGGAATIIGGGVYQSFDAGETWQRIDKREDRLPSQRIWALAFDQRSPNRLLVGSHSSGIYVVERKPGLAAANDGNK
jgi:photosystem II stability/assembly factor-like uncharacterized protein